MGSLKKALCAVLDRDEEIDKAIKEVWKLNQRCGKDMYFWSFSTNYSPAVVKGSGNYFILWGKRGQGVAGSVYHGPLGGFLKYVRGLAKRR